MTPLRRRFVEHLTLRNFSPATIRSYVCCVAGFARHHRRSPADLGAEDVRSFLNPNSGASGLTAAFSGSQSPQVEREGIGSASSRSRKALCPAYTLRKLPHYLRAIDALPLGSFKAQPPCLVIEAVLGIGRAELKDSSPVVVRELDRELAEGKPTIVPPAFVTWVYLVERNALDPFTSFSDRLPDPHA